MRTAARRSGVDPAGPAVYAWTMRSAHIWPLVVVACGPTGGESTGASDSPPMTTSPDTNSPPTTGPDTSTSETTDVGTTSEPPDPTTGAKPDLPRVMEKPPGLVGCTLAAPGTAFAGQTTLGPFTGDRAYFGGEIVDGELAVPTLMLLSPGADAATELSNPQGATGPIITGTVFSMGYDAWIGAWQLSSLVLDGGQSGSVSVTVTIEQLAGDWDAADPADPPRLVGSLAGDLVGPFDAVYCDELDSEVIAE